MDHCRCLPGRGSRAERDIFIIRLVRPRLGCRRKPTGFDGTCDIRRRQVTAHRGGGTSQSLVTGDQANFRTGCLPERCGARLSCSRRGSAAWWRCGSGRSVRLLLK
ncbi:hypothetical protein GCM10027271_45910 [Saccharopolyspora gloriosae]